MTKHLVPTICLLISMNSFAQTAKPGSGKNMEKLIGSWKAVLLSLTDDKDSNKIIRIDLTDSKSIKYFSDTVFYVIDDITVPGQSHDKMAKVAVYG